MVVASDDSKRRWSYARPRLNEVLMVYRRSPALTYLNFFLKGRRLGFFLNNANRLSCEVAISEYASSVVLYNKMFFVSTNHILVFICLAFREYIAIY